VLACKPKKLAIIICAASAPSGVPSRKESATRLAVASTSGSDKKALIMLISNPPVVGGPALAEAADGRSARVDRLLQDVSAAAAVAALEGALVVGAAAAVDIPMTPQLASEPDVALARTRRSRTLSSSAHGSVRALATDAFTVQRAWNACA